MPSVFIELQVGNETPEAFQALQRLVGLLASVCDTERSSTQLVDERPATAPLNASFVVLQVEGEDAHAVVANATASQVWQQDLVSIAVLIEPNETQVSLDPSDLSVLHYRLDRPDSQMVRHTDCNVEITHIPTGRVVRSQKSRSRARNHACALSLLRCHLHAPMPGTLRPSKKPATT